MTGRMSAFLPMIRGAAVCIGLLGLLGIELHFVSAKERGMTSMLTENGAKKSTMLSMSIPPIDVVAPSRTETATFALG